MPRRDSILGLSLQRGRSLFPPSQAAESARRLSEQAVQHARAEQALRAELARAVASADEARLGQAAAEGELAEARLGQRRERPSSASPASASPAGTTGTGSATAGAGGATGAGRLHGGEGDSGGSAGSGDRSGGGALVAHACPEALKQRVEELEQVSGHYKRSGKCFPYLAIVCVLLPYGYPFLNSVSFLFICLGL